MRHHDQKASWGRKVVFFFFPAYTFISLVIIKGYQDRNSNRAGTWRQELIQRPWRGAAY
jgi:hypothetical protein